MPVIVYASWAPCRLCRCALVRAQQPFQRRDRSRVRVRRVGRIVDQERRDRVVDAGLRAVVDRGRQAARDARLGAQHVGELAAELVRHPAAAGIAGVELLVGVDAVVVLDLLVQPIEVAVLDRVGRRSSPRRRRSSSGTGCRWRAAVRRRRVDAVGCCCIRPCCRSPAPSRSGSRRDRTRSPSGRPCSRPRRSCGGPHPGPR